jgi:MHS family shikimate/dehydroshikimate transporter-like MFS transporter
MNIATQFSAVERSGEKTARIRWIVASSVIGTAVEWYDFIIYGTMSALVFNKLFFPMSSAALGSIAAFATYGVGFLARPFGAAIFGHFGDRVGRKAMLATTIVITGLGTFLIGLLPAYDQIGALAPILLVLLRLLQGIGLGGEWGGAVLMVVENAPARSRGLLGATVQMGFPIGNIAAVGTLSLLSVLSEQNFMAWGWRVPFLISIALAGIGLCIRIQLEETPAFRAIAYSNTIAKLPLVDIITTHRRALFTAVGLKLSEISYGSIASVFAVSYVTGQLGMPRSVILNAILLSAVAALVAIPLFGWLSDQIGRKTMFYASLLFAMAFAFPMFWMLNTKDPLTVTLTIVVAIVFGQLVGFGVGASWYSELFPASVRYSGASLGFQIGAAMSGGLTPLAAATFSAWTDGSTWPISVYLIALSLITFAATMVAPETGGEQLR